MKRKVLSLLLCGLLACSMLTACGGSNSSSDAEVNEDTEKVSEQESVEPTESSDIVEPSIYSELMVGTSTMADAKVYATSHVLQFEGGAHTDIQYIYGEFIPNVEGKTVLLYDTNESGDFSSDCIINELITKVSYSSAEESESLCDAISKYLDKAYLRGCYYVDEKFNRPAYIVSDNADALVFIWIDNQYSDEEGYLITVHETKYHSKAEKSCWFDEQGKAFIPEYFKAQGVNETKYNNIDEANIDISSVDVEGMDSDVGNTASETKADAPEAPASDTSQSTSSDNHNYVVNLDNISNELSIGRDDYLCLKLYRDVWDEDKNDFASLPDGIIYPVKEDGEFIFWGEQISDVHKFAEKVSEEKSNLSGGDPIGIRLIIESGVIVSMRVGYNEDI